MMSVDKFIKEQIGTVNDEFLLEAADKELDAKTVTRVYYFERKEKIMEHIKKIASTAACLLLAVAAITTFLYIQGSITPENNSNDLADSVPTESDEIAERLPTETESNDIADISTDLYADGKYTDPLPGNQQRGIMGEYSFADDKTFYNYKSSQDILYYVENGANEAHIACIEPDCAHLTEGCTLFDLRANQTFYHGGSIFITSMGRNQVVMIDPETFDRSEIYNSDGFIYEFFGLGRYLYFKENMSDDTLRFIRYDLETEKSEVIKTPESVSNFYSETAYDGRIYAQSSPNCIWSMNEDLEDQKLILEEKNIIDFTVRDNAIYYISTDSDEVNVDLDKKTDHGYKLCKYDLNKGEKNVIKENVVRFSLYGEKIYYSVFESVNVGKFTNHRGDLKTGEFYTEIGDAYVNHGNKVFEGILTEDVIIDTGKVITSLDGYYLDHDYCVHNGYLYGFMSTITETDGVYQINSEKYRFSLDDGEWYNLDTISE